MQESRLTCANSHRDSYVAANTNSSLRTEQFETLPT